MSHGQVLHDESRIDHYRESRRQERLMKSERPLVLIMNAEV